MFTKYKIINWVPALVLLWITYPGIAQPNITRLEYYVDTDPGYGSGIMVSIPSSNNISTNFSVNFSGLKEGVHLVGVRSRDANGRWSLDERWLFVRPFETPGSETPPNFSRVEYYVNNDPGKGLATPMTIPVGNDHSNLSFNLNINALKQGVNFVGVRSRDVNGRWSLDERWLFIRPFETPGNATPPNLSRVEYYVNNDPGKGLATPITIPTGNDLSNLSFNLDLSALKQGVNLVGVRSRDANGRWSLDERWLFIKPFPVNASSPVSPINYMEYFIDTDPGFGKGTKIALDPKGQIAQKIITANINNLSSGQHNLIVRSRNAQGVWSHENRWLFTLASPKSGTSIEVNSLALGAACLEGTFSLGYDISGTFNPGNQFIAELSNAAGSFGSPVTIGSVSGTVDGLMQVTLPANITPSNNYKFRMRSTNPAVIGAASSIPVEIYKYNIGKDTTVFVRCEFDKFDLTTINTFTFEGGSFLWNTANPTQAPVGTHLIYAVSAIGCKDTASVTVGQQANVWNGTQNNNWFNPANWSMGTVPTDVSHVIVNSGTPNPCVISGANGTAASVRLNGGATIQIQPSFKLSIVGNCNQLPLP